ncbi:hypothetical protein INR49_015523 [Caranx melampygus]|nr:hypothetical protein INR49_015523 [Caranx melampygus]
MLPSGVVGNVAITKFTDLRRESHPNTSWAPAHIFRSNPSTQRLEYTDADGVTDTSYNCSAILQEDKKALEKAKLLTEDKRFRKTVQIPDENYMNATRDCGKFKLSRKYLTVSSSQEEEDFPLAYSIVVHHKVQNFERLLRAIYVPHNLYCIHVDKKAEHSFFSAVMAIASCFPNVFMVSQPVSVVYAAWPRVQADLNCMADLYKANTTWKYFINLCGQDFPLKTNLEMVRMLRSLKGSNSLESEQMPEGKRERVTKSYKIVNGNIQATGKAKDPPPFNLPIMSGNAYIVVCRGYIRSVLEDSRIQTLIEWAKDTFSPDEFLWATIQRMPGVPGSARPHPKFDMSDMHAVARLVKWDGHEGSEDAVHAVYPECHGNHGDKEALEKAKLLSITKDFHKSIRIPNEYYMNATRDCRKFKLSRKYLTVSSSQEEEDFPLAHSIVVHHKVQNFERLLRAIYVPHNLYCIHVDKNAEHSFFSAVMAIASCFPNVFMVSQPVSVVYAAWPRVQADLNCMADLYKASTKWKYFINLCGQDFPLKTNLEMVRMLRSLKGSNSLESEQMPEGKKWRVKNSQKIVDGNIQIDLNDHKHSQGAGKAKDPPPFNLPIMSGNAYIVVCQGYVRSVLEDSRIQTLIEWAKDTYSPDEFLWATINRMPGVPGSARPHPKYDMSDMHAVARLVKWQWHEGSKGSVEEVYPECHGNHRIYVLQWHHLKLLLHPDKTLLNPLFVTSALLSLEDNGPWVSKPSSSQVSDKDDDTLSLCCKPLILSATSSGKNLTPQLLGGTGGERDSNPRGEGFLKKSPPGPAPGPPAEASPTGLSSLRNTELSFEERLLRMASFSTHAPAQRVMSADLCVSSFIAPLLPLGGACASLTSENLPQRCSDVLRCFLKNLPGDCRHRRRCPIIPCILLPVVMDHAQDAGLQSVVLRARRATPDYDPGRTTVADTLHLQQERSL